MSCDHKAEVRKQYNDYPSLDDQNSETYEIQWLVVDFMQVHRDFLMDASVILELVSWRILLTTTTQRQKCRKIDI